MFRHQPLLTSTVMIGCCILHNLCVREKPMPAYPSILSNHLSKLVKTRYMRVQRVTNKVQQGGTPRHYCHTTQKSQFSTYLGSVCFWYSGEKRNTKHKIASFFVLLNCGLLNKLWLFLYWIKKSVSTAAASCKTLIRKHNYVYRLMDG